MFVLDSSSSVSLVQQIVDGFSHLVDEGTLRSGAKLPSIRQFAHAHGVSVYTVVDAYDRLVAQGYFVSRPHLGFFVRRRRQDDDQVPVGGDRYDFDSMYYMRRIFEHRGLSRKPGCGWLPEDWLFGEGVRRALRTLASGEISISGYGEPKGFVPLRQLVRDLLAEQEVALTTEQILLTQGSSHALDLIARRLVHAGDAVLIDDPSYANLCFGLRLLGADLLGVTRTPEGYDLALLEHLLQTHRPKVFFTQPRLHCPTGASATLAHMYRVLQLAEKYDVTLVENDIYSDLDPRPHPSLASLDQLKRVVYISSFSKTISPNLRVGYMAGHPELIEDLAQLKMIAGLTSAELSERIVYGALIDGRWRKHAKTLRERLTAAHEKIAARFLELGFELFTEPKAGMFLWVRHPQIADANVLALRATEHDILLGPGHLFSPGLEPSPWLRFNIAFCEDEAVFDFLQQEIARAEAGRSGLTNY